MKSDYVILWEAHRGGGGCEVPESTPASFEYAWRLGGIPEADVNMTRDHVAMSLHDGTLDRTAQALKPEWKGKHISELTGDEVRSVDIGGGVWPHQHVPSIPEILDRLRKDPAKEIIIDYKSAPLDKLAALIHSRGVEKQVTLATTDEKVAAGFRYFAPEVRIKIWIGGSPEAIMTRFREMAKRNFGGFDQIQLHLAFDAKKKPWPFSLSREEIREALAATKPAGVLLQLFAMDFDRDGLFALLDLGVRSFAVDHPHKFTLFTAEYEAAKSWHEPVENSPQIRNRPAPVAQP